MKYNFLCYTETAKHLTQRRKYEKTVIIGINSHRIGRMWRQ